VTMTSIIAVTATRLLYLSEKVSLRWQSDGEVAAAVLNSATSQQVEETDF
jgi:hypothetical protein